MIPTVLLVPALLLATVDDEERYDQRLREAQRDAGERHLDLALWCEGRGLRGLAAAEAMLALERSGGQAPGAKQVLKTLQNVKAAERESNLAPPPASARSYADRARRARAEDEEDLLELYAWAHGQGLEGRARDGFLQLLLARDEPLAFDARGRVELESGAIPEDVSIWLRGEAFRVDDRVVLAEGKARHVPDPDAIHAVEAERLAVWTTLPREAADALVARGAALLEELEEAHAAPLLERPSLLVYATEDAFRAHLKSARLKTGADTRSATDTRALLGVLNAEGLDEEQLAALAMSELTRLFCCGAVRAVRPSWYVEALAVEHGRGAPSAEELRALRTGDGWLPLDELLEAGPADLRGPDDGSVALQAWALLDYLRVHAKARHEKAFERWEDLSRAVAAGARANDGRRRRTEPAEDLLRAQLGDDLLDLEVEFEEHLDRL